MPLAGSVSMDVSHPRSGLLRQAIPPVSITILSVALVAVLLSAVSRTGHTLSYDEPTTANRIRLEVPDLLNDCRANGAFPVYYLMLKRWAAVFGESEFALRAFSLVWLAAAVVVVGAVAARFGGYRAGLLAALLLASADLSAHHGANARPYALLLLLASASCALALLVADPQVEETARQRVRGRRTMLFAAGLSLVHSIGFLVHPLFIVVAGATAGAGLMVMRGRARGYTVAAAVLGTAASLLVWPIELLGTANRATEWIPRLSWDDVSLGASFVWGRVRGTLLLCWLLALMLGRATAAWWLGSSQAGNVRSETAARLAGLVGLLAALAPLAISLVKPVFVPERSFVFALPGLCVWAGLFMARSPSLPFTWLLMGVVLAGSARHALVSGATDPVPTRRSLERILQEAEAHDLFVVGHISGQEVAYYRRRLGAPSSIEQVTFPAETSRHPGWFDDRAVAERGAEVEREAAALASSAAGRAGSIWVFEGGTDEARAATAAVRRKLGRFRQGTELTGLRGSYFDTVVKFTGGAVPD